MDSILQSHALEQRTQTFLGQLFGKERIDLAVNTNVRLINFNGKVPNLRVSVPGDRVLQGARRWQNTVILAVKTSLNTR